MKLKILLIFLSSFFFESSAYATKLGTPDIDDIEYPDDEEPTKMEIMLGKTLFFDPRLSVNEEQSCASCHNPDLGFGDGMAKGIGTMGSDLGRNTPHLYNLAFSNAMFWDGRMSTLEHQALGPIEAEGEMNMPLGELIPRLKKVTFYRNTFKSVYGKSGINKENLGKAIAAFERTINSLNSPFDRYIAGEKHAMNKSQVRGMEIFKGKGNCIACHDGANFTDDSFHNIGVGGKDLGRAAITGDSLMNGAFKTPGLRNTLLTAPYLHDGSAGSLEDVIELYNVGGFDKTNVSKLIKPLNLTQNEKFDLIAFLGALTSPVTITRPELP